MPESSPFLIAQITDTHLFANEQAEMMGIKTAHSLQAVLEHVKTLQPQPDLLMLTGDLSQDDTPESYERLRDLILPLGIPTCWIPGNHDQTSAIQSVLQGGCISPDKQFQMGGWNVLLLSSMLKNQVYGYLSDETLTHLEQTLAASDRPTLIALHHPPLSIGSDWMDEINLQNTNLLLEMIDQFPQVKLVVFGHIHQEFSGDRHGVRYLGSPSTCVQFKPQMPDLAIDAMQPGFRLIQLFPDGSFSTQVKRVSG